MTGEFWRGEYLLNNTILGPWSKLWQDCSYVKHDMIMKENTLFPPTPHDDRIMDWGGQWEQVDLTEGMVTLQWDGLHAELW